MVRAATASIVLLLTAEFGSEVVDVRDRGAVDLKTFECRDTPRSTMIQRVCYDRAQATLIVNVKGAYREYCALQAATFDGLMTATSMGQFFKSHIEAAGSDGSYDCPTRRAPGS
jgi:KTSC domain